MSYVSSIKKDGENIILYKCSEPVPELLMAAGGSITIGFLDTETTGLDKLNDEVIELALKIVKFEEGSGKIVSTDHEYESFNDPHKPLDEEITLITGISDEMVKGKSIDWSHVDDILRDTEIILSEISQGNYSSELYLGSIADQSNLSSILGIISEEDSLEEYGSEIGSLLPRLNELNVNEWKAFSLRIADMVGTSITTLFTIFGSFSIIVGLL